jgi:Rod binding domain-containing protein
MTAAVKGFVAGSGPALGRAPRMQWPTEEQLRARLTADLATDAKGRKIEGEELTKLVDERVSKELGRNKALKCAYRDMEAFFVGMLMQEMKKNSLVSENEFEGGRGEEIFDKMLTQERAKAMTARGNGFGIADKMEQGYLRNLSRGEIPAELRGPSDDEISAVMQMAASVGKVAAPTAAAHSANDSGLSSMREAMARRDVKTAYGTKGRDAK